MYEEIDRRTILRGTAALGAGAALTGLASSSAAAGFARIAPAGRRRTGADLIIRNGRVLVLGRRSRVYDAVAIRDGVIVGLGNDSSIRRFKGPHTEVLDAQRGTVIPGINDSHNHLGALGLSLPPYQLNVNTSSLDELVAIVRAAAEAAPDPDSWIRGRGWQELRIPRAPTAADIDPVSGNHPVVLNDFSAHAVSVNTRAMQLAGITRDTVPPPGGVIDKDAEGNPTGVFRETAMSLVTRVVPPFTAAERAAALDNGIRLVQSFGITSVTEPGTGSPAAYAAKAEDGTLGIRVTCLRSGGRTAATMRDAIANTVPLTVDPRWVRVAGFKIFADGIPRQRTAWMNDPYPDGSNGSLTLGGATHEEQLAHLHEMILLASQAGQQVGTHACGSATTDQTVAAYANAIASLPRGSDLRHYVIHCNFPSSQTLKKMARNQIGANMNAEILYLQGRVLEPIIGPELTSYQWPYRSAIRAGVVTATGSDAPVVEFNWLRGAYAAVTRKGEDGSQAGTVERVGIDDVLETYTAAGAWQDHADHWKGSLEPGMAADICIVDGSLRTRRPEELLDMDVSTTIVNGEVVFDRSTESGRDARAVGAAYAASRKKGSGHDCSDPGACCCQVAREIVGEA